MKLVIGNKNYSSWSLRPWILLKHFKIEFEEEFHYLYTDTFESELAAYNSDSKVPILLDDDTLIWDSLSILEYISEQHLNGQGWPNDKKARAMARSMSNEMHSSFTYIRNELPMNCRKSFETISLTEEAKHEIKRVKFLWNQCRNQFKDKGEWLFGAFSIADAMFAPIAIRFNGYNIPANDIEQNYINAILNHPNIQEWIEDAKQETETLDFAEL